ncbi:MAG: glycoside hydrolase family 38 C-terminal domain-containing protein [Candidatus Thorarchaeota archaeon]|nr:glycoside hydrolase family 38 C-terminal domain-containing protein [Candidatus Thorarchaeota archaeon]
MGDRWTVTLCPFLHFDNARTQSYEHNISIVAWNVKSVLDYLDVNPLHKFCIDQVTLLEGFRRLFPNYWDTLHQMVLEGRIEIVGGTYVMPDLLIPTGESLIRQFLVGNDYIRRELGVSVRTGWAIDSAGHCAQMPQILRQVGIDSYFFWRGKSQKSATEFVWRGPDGSRVNAIWLSKGYDSAAWLSENNQEAFSNLLHLIDETGPKSASHNIFLPVGGELVPPPPHLADIVSKWNETFPETRASISTPHEFTEKLKTVQSDLPIISGELSSGRFTAMRSGGLSSRIKLKILNRRLETLLYLCELYLSLNKNNTQNQSLGNIWKMLLFNQDHNIIRGVISDDAYRLAVRRYNQALDMADELLELAMGSAIIGLSSNDLGASIIVSNPVPWVRSDIARIAPDKLLLDGEYFEVVDPSGDSIPYQIVSDNSDSTSIEIIFLAEDMPSLGQRVYTVRRTDSPPEFETELRSGMNWVESGEFILEFDEFSGGISRLFDKTAQAEMIAQGCTSITMDNDVGDLYRYSPSALASTTSKITSLRSPGKITICESGPVRTVAEIRSTIAHSEFTQRVTMYSKMRRVDIELEIDFKGINRRVRYNVPLQIFTSEVHTGSQFMVERRTLSSSRQSDFVDHGCGTFNALDWVDASGPESGFCISTIGLHEFELIDGVISTTLLRSVGHLSHGIDDDVIETPRASENDTHHYKLAFLPHEGDWNSGRVHRRSVEHRLPLIGYSLKGGVAERPLEKSLLEVEGTELELSCFKPTDADSEYVLRFYEISGNRGMSTIKFAQNVQRAILVDLLENEIGELGVQGKEVSISADPYSIITMKVQLN